MASRSQVASRKTEESKRLVDSRESSPEKRLDEKPKEDTAEMKAKKVKAAKKTQQIMQQTRHMKEIIEKPDETVKQTTNKKIEKNVNKKLTKLKDEYEPFRELKDEEKCDKDIKVEIEHALYVAMDKKVKAEEKQKEYLDTIEYLKGKIRELDSEVRTLRTENTDLKEAVEEFEASGARRRPKPKPKAPAQTAGGKKQAQGEPEKQ